MLRLRRRVVKRIHCSEFIAQLDVWLKSSNAISSLSRDQQQI
jgi:hypothetical protein